MVPYLSSLWDRGLDVLSTTFDRVTGALLADLGNARVGEASSTGAEVWQDVGFASRPPRPQAQREGAQVLLLRGSDRDAIIGCRDLRARELYAVLADGETCLYAAGPDGAGRARILLRGDGAIVVETSAAGKDRLAITVAPGEGSVRLDGARGHALTIDEQGITLAAGQASLTLRADGSARLAGAAQTVIDGTSILLGEGGPPIPALRGPTGLAGTASVKVQIGA